MTQIRVDKDQTTAGSSAGERAHSAYYVRPVQPSDIADGLGLARSFLADAAIPMESVEGLLAHNGDSFWAMFRRGEGTARRDQMVAVAGLLLLNTEGRALLHDPAFDPKAVSLAQLVPAGSRPEAIYVSGIIGRGVGDVAVALFNEALTDRYGLRPLYTRAITEAGRTLMLRSGYRPLVPGQEGLGAMYYIDRSKPSRARATTTPRRRVRYRVEPVSSAQQFEQAMAIRTIFLTEQNCPYEEEFDGNDRSGTLFIGYVDGEPAATLRIRYFADFFKMERLAVLPRFRRTLVAKEIVLAAINFCRRKGYRKGFGFAQERYVPFWSKFGFKPTARNCQLKVSDYDYVEMYGDLEPHDAPLTMDSDPYVLIRPEGYWDEPGILERTSTRHQAAVP